MTTLPVPYHLRPMTLDDLDAVVAIEHASFPTPWPVEGYRHELSQNERAHYWVLTCDEYVLGYGGYWLVAGEMHVSIIAIDPAARGYGLGELLFVQMLAVALEQGAASAELEVRERNTVAQALYRKYAFEAVGRRRGYYRDTGEDAILMTADMSVPDYRQRLAAWQEAVVERLRTAPSRPPGCI